MLIKIRRGWDISENDITPQSLSLNRRSFIRTLAVGAVSGGMLSAYDGGGARAAEPAVRNERYRLDRPVTAEKLATEHNNFYEFGSSKNIWRKAKKLPTDPWQVTIDGLVESPRQMDMDDLLKAVTVEERLYRHRCVEAWSMAVPWTGFALRDLVALARPLSQAKYVRFESFHLPDVASGQKATWYPWPYVEGLTLDEATHDLAFLATGLYGQDLPAQNGGPFRLVVPWKYGFKSIKSVTRLSFTAERPLSFWEELQASEYGFWANVNPAVPHPRWSQASEQPLGQSERVPTLLYNGYAESVAGLYSGREAERLFV